PMATPREQKPTRVTRPPSGQYHGHLVLQRSEEISGVKQLSGSSGPFACETPIEEPLGGLDDEGRRERVDVATLCRRATFAVPVAGDNVHHELLGGAAALVGGTGWGRFRVGKIPEWCEVHVRTDVAGPNVTRDRDRLREW